MAFFKLTTDKTIRRLRWVLLLVMIMDVTCTLIGQPHTYWQDPANAREFEPIVRFFMVRGFAIFALVAVAYGLAIIFIVSVMPRKAGLVILFTLLLAHFQGASSWLLYNFGLSSRMETIFEIGLGLLIALAIGKAKSEA